MKCSLRHWKQYDDDDLEDESRSTTPSLPSSPSESELDFDAGFTTHTVTFKCMGTTKGADHQEALRSASCLLGEGSNVPIRLQPEPDNPNAIAFECQIGNDWKRIGYVVRDTLVEVHEAISERKIISWIKYLLCWMKSGPGFYAGIDVSLRGSWSSKCTRVASTK